MNPTNEYNSESDTSKNIFENGVTPHGGGDNVTMGT